jgi:hypothetical protein
MQVSGALDAAEAAVASEGKGGTEGQKEVEDMRCQVREAIQVLKLQKWEMGM